MPSPNQPSRKTRGRRSAARSLASQKSPQLLGELTLWTLLLVTWWVHSTDLKDAFRLPKQALAQSLALLSLVFLAWGLRRLDRLGLEELRRVPALLACLPLLLVATLGLATSSRPGIVAEALIPLWIGGAALVGWSTGLSRPALDRLLGVLVLAAAALALVGILQFHGLYHPFDFAGEAGKQRIGVTSFAGNAGDLSIFLVLPCLIAQQRLAVGWQSRGVRYWLWAAGLVLVLYGLAVSQTLSALAAVAAGSLLLWWRLLPRRRFLMLAAGALVLAGAALLTVAPLRSRVATKLDELRGGEINYLLTGRLDGWRAAGWMVREHPLTGVGHGAYRVHFAEAKLALLEEGVPFFEAQRNVMFANAHNEYLEVAAELGLPGLLALLWGMWVLLRRLGRSDGEGAGAFVSGSPRQALAWAGCLALAVLCLAQFPFRIALTGFAAVLFSSWVFAGEEPAGGGAA